MKREILTLVATTATAVAVLLALPTTSALEPVVVEPRPGGDAFVAQKVRP